MSPATIVKRKKKWTTDFTKDDVEKMYEDNDIMHAIVASSQYSMAWFIKQMFNNQQGKPLEIMPFQMVMLDMLWHKKFPMIIGCRGMGKCQRGEDLVQTDNGMYRFDELISRDASEMTKLPINMRAVGENGAHDIGYGWNNGIKQTKKIATRYGYNIEVTLEHKIRVLDYDGKIVWKQSKDIDRGDKVVIVRDQYNFGKRSDISIDQGWWLGATIGDGYIGQKHNISLTNVDEDIIAEWCRIGEQWSDSKVVLRKCRDRTQSYFINGADFNRKINIDLGCNFALAHDKQIPLAVRQSNQNVVAAFLSGLFDTDGCCESSRISYCTVSERLMHQVQSCLLAFGIISSQREKYTVCNGSKFKSFELIISGSDNCKLFADYIGFRCQRKQDRLMRLCDKKSNPNLDVVPHEIGLDLLLKLSASYRKKYPNPKCGYNYHRQLLAPSQLKQYRVSYEKLGKILDFTKELNHLSYWKKLKAIHDKHYLFDEVVQIEDGECQTFDIHVPNDHTFISNGFISHNTFMLALYSLLRCILVQGSKIVIAGSGFRQAKLVFKYIEALYRQSPLIQEACNERPKYGSDEATLRIGLSQISAIPIGDGSKIRGMRATVLICDEFASINPEIYEIVLSPFTSVHLNPAEKARTMKFVRRLESLGANQDVIDRILNTQDFGNQVVLSGTASYQYNHFYKRYRVYKTFVQSKGDPKKLKQSLEQHTMQSTGTMAHLDADDVKRMAMTWHHYAVYQVPFHALPEGFLDEDSVRKDKASFTPVRFAMEYEAAFPEDSDGFFKRSYIDSATPTDDKVAIELYGDPRFTYIMGLDPARHNDNFGCVVLKLTPRGRELVYCRTWDRTKHEVSAKNIFEIMRRFPTIEYIAMDKGGGGDAVCEWLCKDQEGVDPEERLWPIPDQLESKADRGQPGRHIIELVNFKGWVASAAYSLEAAITRQDLWFPHTGDDIAVRDQYMRHFGEHELGEAAKLLISQDLWGVDDWESEADGRRVKLGVYQEIEECKNETCAIVKTVTPGGTEQFELPKLEEQPEGLDMRRRDRFSALMLANYGAKVYTGQERRKGKNVPGTTSGQPKSMSRRSLTRRRHGRKGRTCY